MVSAIGSAISGYNAAVQRINVAANNIANASSTSTTTNGVTANTPYVPQQLVQSAQVNGGVATSTQPVTPASISVSDPDSSSGTSQLPNVDPAQQLVQTQLATYNAQASLNVIKADQKNFQSLLNILS